MPAPPEQIERIAQAIWPYLKGNIPESKEAALAAYRITLESIMEPSETVVEAAAKAIALGADGNAQQPGNTVWKHYTDDARAGFQAGISQLIKDAQGEEGSALTLTPEGNQP